MSAAVTKSPLSTFEEYQQWEGKWELVEGVHYAMSPAPLPKHQYIASNISYEFKHALKGCKGKRKCKVYEPIDYKISDTTVFQPDILIVCNEIKKAYLDFAPDLVVEILSPSSIIMDRQTKYFAYEKQGIPYYLIVSPEEEIVEVYELENGSYTLAKKDHFMHTFRLEDCDAAIDFNEIRA